VFTTRQKPRQADVAVVTAKVVRKAEDEGTGGVVVMHNL
jgi:hypothetical protein